MSGGFKQRPNKKRKYNDNQDSQSQIQQPIIRFNPEARPPQGPRRKYYNSAIKHSAPRRVEHDGMERSTSRDHLQSPWRTSSEGTSSSTLLTEQPEYLQSQGGRGNQQNTSNLKTNSQSQYSSIEPEIEQSTQDRTNNDDAKDDVVDSYKTPSPMADPTPPNPRIEHDDDCSNDSVMDTDDAPHEDEMPVDNHSVSNVGDQGNDQDWEYNYAIEDPATEVSFAPQSALQLAPANTATLDLNHSIFDVPDDGMADVTANPWTTSP